MSVAALIDGTGFVLHVLWLYWLEFKGEGGELAPRVEWRGSWRLLMGKRLGSLLAFIMGCELRNLSGILHGRGWWRRLRCH